MAAATPITVAYGDGIGPEIMEATLLVLREVGAPLQIDTIEVGEKQYMAGHSSGIPADAWDTLKRNKVFLKAPITTPQGGGYKSLNVTMRKTLGLYANIRPVVSYTPYVQTPHADMNLVIVRENEEDLYAGIEHRQTDDCVQCLKLITHNGSEKIIRYAFEYAVANNRKKVTCMSKDNIMKLADGMFHKIFDAVGAEYPQIEKEHYIIDIGAARIAAKPGIFDVIVTENLYGDIISDIAAEVSGSVGLAGSSNIGEEVAMFEAIHGSAPTMAGKNTANPSGLMHAAIMMLVHIGDAEGASLFHNAWLKTIEDGIHTKDIYNEAHSKELVGTQEFAKAVAARIGKKPTSFTPISYTPKAQDKSKLKPKARAPQKKELVGFDAFLDWRGTSPKELGNKIGNFKDGNLALKLIASRGLKVWPGDYENASVSDHWRCQFLADGKTVTNQQIVTILKQFADAGLDVIKTENLYNFDGKAGYSQAQGE